jgi:hypothetical protein
MREREAGREPPCPHCRLAEAEAILRGISDGHHNLGPLAAMIEAFLGRSVEMDDHSCECCMSEEDGHPCAAGEGCRAPDREDVTR